MSEPIPSGIPHGCQITVASDSVWEAVDVEFADLGIRGQLDHRGVLRFWIETRLDRLHPELQRKYGNVRARELFAAMLQHLAGRIEKIRGEWYYGDNLIAFDDLVRRQGVSTSIAALQTWTGIQAVAHGFDHATVVVAKGHPASRHCYKRVLVDFTRTSNDRKTHESGC